MENKMTKRKELLDFETENGFNPMHLNDLKKLARVFPRATQYRIYFLLMINSASRPSEIIELNWNNFLNDVLVYKPGKQHGKVTRRVRLSPGTYKELQEYRQNNFFANGQLFPFKYKNISTNVFNKQVRTKLKGKFEIYSPYIYSKAVRNAHYYTLRSVRTTIATIIFSYYREIYGDSVALARTSMWIGHKSERMTADHYIKHLHKLGLENIPKKMSFLELIDNILYGEAQGVLDDFGERETNLDEFNKYVLDPLEI